MTLDKFRLDEKVAPGLAEAGAGLPVFLAAAASARTAAESISEDVDGRR